MGHVTMKHLASELGVSVTTVSNAYNKPDRLSADLRTRILAKGEEMGYCGPNAAGRLLRSGKANSVGVLADGGYSFAFSDRYALKMFRALSHELEDAGTSLTLLPTGPNRDYVGAIATAVVDAVISLSSSLDTEVLAFLERRSVRVIHGQMVPDGEYVSIDDYAAGVAIGTHIRELGHRRVGILLQASSTETEGFSDHLDDTVSFWAARRWGIADGLGPDIQATAMLVPPPEDPRRWAEVDTALHAATPVTALMCLSDRLALSTLEALPQIDPDLATQVAVTGFDGLVESTEVGLTTIHQPIEEKGRLSARLAIDPDPAQRQIVLPFSLIRGLTSRPAPD